LAPALIVIETFTRYVAQVFHARQYPREAGARNTAQFANLVRLQGSRVDQGAHDAPLLFRDAMCVEDGPETGDYLLACLQQQQRQIAVPQFGPFARISVFPNHSHLPGRRAVSQS